MQCSITFKPAQVSNGRRGLNIDRVGHLFAECVEPPSLSNRFRDTTHIACIYDHERLSTFTLDITQRPVLLSSFISKSASKRLGDEPASGVGPLFILRRSVKAASEPSSFVSWHSSSQAFRFMQAHSPLSSPSSSASVKRNAPHSSIAPPYPTIAL